MCIHLNMVLVQVDTTMVAASSTQPRQARLQQDGLMSHRSDEYSLRERHHLSRLAGDDVAFDVSLKPKCEYL